MAFPDINKNKDINEIINDNNVSKMVFNYKHLFTYHNIS